MPETLVFWEPSEGGLPSRFAPAREHPDLQAGPWATGVVFDRESGALYRSLYNPRDAYYTLEPLPEAVAAVLPESAPLERVWPALDAADFHATEPVSEYFRLARFDYAAALERLVAEIPRARDDAPRFRRLMLCLRNLLGNPGVKQGEPLVIGDPDALARLLLGDMWAYQGSSGWDMGPVRDTAIRHLVSAREGPAADRVAGIDPEIRARLLGHVGLEDIHARRTKARAKVAMGDVVLDQARSRRRDPARYRVTGHKPVAEAAVDLDWSSPAWRYGAFLPAALQAWLFMEVLAPAAEPDADLSRVFLVTVVLPFYAAAAARVHGFGDRGVFRLYLQRLRSAMADYFAFGFLVVVAALLLTAVLAPFVDLRAPDAHRWAGPLYGLLPLVMLARWWPFVVVPFIYPGGYVDHAGWSWWEGPGLTQAWHLTRGARALREATLPVLGAGLVVVWGYLTLRGWVDGDPLVGPLLNGLFYLGALPALTLLAFRRAFVLARARADEITEAG